MVQNQFTVNMDMAVSTCKNLQLTAVAHNLLQVTIWGLFCKVSCCYMDAPSFVMRQRMVLCFGFLKGGAFSECLKE